MSNDPIGFKLINPMEEPGKPRSGFKVIEANNSYSYVANNPVIFTDPTGLVIDWVQGNGVSNADFKKVVAMGDSIMNSNTLAGKRFKELHDSQTVTVQINVNSSGLTNANADNWTDATNGTGSDSTVNININDSGNYMNEQVAKDLEVSLVHEVSGHSYDYAKGKSPYNGTRGQGTWPGKFLLEQNAVAMENEYRDYKGLQQRPTYGGIWDMPIYDNSTGTWSVKPGNFPNGVNYNPLPGPAVRWTP